VRDQKCNSQHYSFGSAPKITVAGTNSLDLFIFFEFYHVKFVIVV